MLRKQLQHSLEPKGSVSRPCADAHYFGEVNAPIPCVQRGLDSTFHPKESVLKDRAPCRSPSRWEAGKLVACPSRMEAETINPLKLRLTDKVEGE